MTLSPSQQDLLRSQLKSQEIPKLSSQFREQTKNILLTHFDHLPSARPRKATLFSFLGGSLVLATLALIFSYSLIRTSFLSQKDPDLVSMQQDLQTFSIPEESFE